MSHTNITQTPSRRPSPGLVIAAVFCIGVAALGAGRAAQDTHRVNRLELVDDEGRIAMVLDVSDSGRPRLSIIEGEQAALFELSASELRLITPQPAGDDEQDPQVRVSVIQLDALHALAGAALPGGVAAEPGEDESTLLRIRYLQEQVDALRAEQRQMEREHRRDEPLGRDVSDPLRLQRVIDDVQRKLRDMENDRTRTSRDITDLERRVRTIEMKIREL